MSLAKWWDRAIGARSDWMDRDFVAFEPMTAPTAALCSGRGLRLVEPGGEFRAGFEVRVG
jgi:galactose mutarotase-like enzyme